MRGQVHTLEAIIAGLLLLTSVVFSLQMTAVTPLSASTSSQHIENQQQAMAEGVLANAAESGALREAVLHWNESSGEFFNTSQEYYYTHRAPSNEFGAMLERQFGDRGLAYNVRLRYADASGDIEMPMGITKGQSTPEGNVAWMVYRGAPTDNAVMSSRTVVIADDAHLYNHSSVETSTSVTQSYLPDAAPDSSVYNVVRVEVIVWRI